MAFMCTLVVQGERNSRPVRGLMSKPGNRFCSVPCSPGLFETVKKTIPSGTTDSVTGSSIDMVIVMRNETNKVTTRLGFESGICCLTERCAPHSLQFWELMSAAVRIWWRMRSFPRQLHSHDALLAFSESQLRSRTTIGERRCRHESSDDDVDNLLMLLKE